MKKVCYLLFFMLSLTFANNNATLSNIDPQVGDVLIINKTDANGYKYIFFPKLNFIVKKGGLASYNIVEGNHAVIKKVEFNMNWLIWIVVILGFVFIICFVILLLCYRTLSRYFLRNSCFY